MGRNIFSIGSEKPAAVYSILLFWEVIPQPQVSLVRFVGLLTSRMISQTSASVTTSVKPITAMSGMGNVKPSAENIRNEKIPKNKQAAAIIIGPAIIAGETSLALRASSERGVARKITPNAFTKQAAASALVSANSESPRNNNIFRKGLP